MVIPQDPPEVDYGSDCDDWLYDPRTIWLQSEIARLEKERDKWEKTARWCYPCMAAAEGDEARRYFPWLEDE